MGSKTGIAWTDMTFNPWWGCTKVSPACDNCYAATVARNRKLEVWGSKTPRQQTSQNNRQKPLAWERKAVREGCRYKVFTLSMGDVMDGEVPLAWREELWTLINQTPHLDWQLLTKRPENYHRFLPEKFTHNNVWLGTTAENQQYFDLRWPAMMRLKEHFPGAPLWISYEPALGPLSVASQVIKPDWIIFGGESGSGARSTDVNWARSLREECQRYGLAFFMKQMAAASLVKAKQLIPTDLAVRQYPEWVQLVTSPPIVKSST